MPIIKSAVKQMHRSRANAARNLVRKRHMKDAIQNVMALIQEKKLEDAKKALPVAYKHIDLAAKNHLCHPRNAAHRKSQLARALAAASK